MPSSASSCDWWKAVTASCGETILNSPTFSILYWLNSSYFSTLTNLSCLVSPHSASQCPFAAYIVQDLALYQVSSALCETQQHQKSVGSWIVLAVQLVRGAAWWRTRPLCNSNGCTCQSFLSSDWKPARTIKVKHRFFLNGLRFCTTVKRKYKKPWMINGMGRLCHHHAVFSFQFFPGTDLLQQINGNIVTAEQILNLAVNWIYQMLLLTKQMWLHMFLRSLGLRMVICPFYF